MGDSLIMGNFPNKIVIILTRFNFFKILTPSTKTQLIILTSGQSQKWCFHEKLFTNPM